MILPETWKFWHRVRVVPGGCWVWIGNRTPSGYGLMSVYDVARRGPRTLYAHRWSVLLAGRTITPGHEVDHLCRNRWCVNPEHLDVVDHAENMRRIRVEAAA